MKETNFFSGPAEGIPYPAGSRRIERLDEYEKLFDPAFEVRGEASPCYTLYPRRKGVPEKIKDLVPNVKLIYLVRDPIARAVSQYHFRVAVENEQRSLSEALSDYSDPNSLYTCPGFYASQIDKYLTHFPQERLLVVDQADLLTHRQSTLREIFTFLSVDSSFVSPRFEEEVNTGKELRTYSPLVVLQRRVKVSPLMQRLILQRLSPDVRRSLRHTVQRITSQPLEPPTLDDGTRARLQELYSDDTSRLRVLTGKKFPTWDG